MNEWIKHWPHIVMGCLSLGISLLQYGNLLKPTINNFGTCGVPHSPSLPVPFPSMGTINVAGNIMLHSYSYSSISMKYYTTITYLGFVSYQ